MMGAAQSAWANLFGAAGGDRAEEEKREERADRKDRKKDKTKGKDR